ncbi:phospholipase D family protein [Desulfomarina sp.]
MNNSKQSRSTPLAYISSVYSGETMLQFINVLKSSNILLASLCTIALFMNGCSSVYVPYPVGDRIPDYSLNGTDTRLARLFADDIASHPELSGAFLLDQGEEALLWRGALTDLAEKSIDIQTFIWSDDTVGTIGAARLLQAAQRGVRIRVIVDFVTLEVDSDYLVMLNDHPNITIRLYNPYPGLDAPLGLRVAGGSIASFKRFNRRMHNKIFLVDGTVLVIGGRNNADEYYDMHESMNFRDRDVLVIGDILDKAGKGFDDYWNSTWSVDLSQVCPRKINREKRQAYFKELIAFADDPVHFPPRFTTALETTRQALLALPGQLFWGKADVTYDIPGKNGRILSLHGYSKTGDFLTRTFLEAQSQILVETPYMITMPGTLELFENLHKRGVKISILTDSVASAEGDAVFAGYKQHRRSILRRGVTLYELRPDPAFRKQLFPRFSGLNKIPEISLHAKTAVIDQHIVLIGSFNLDPRSTHLNTEHVFRIDSPELARQVSSILTSDMDLENCWHVTMDSKEALTWETRRNGKTEISSKEPDISLWERIRLFFLLLLPVNPVL